MVGTFYMPSSVWNEMVPFNNTDFFSVLSVGCVAAGIFLIQSVRSNATVSNRFRNSNCENHILNIIQ